MDCWSPLSTLHYPHWGGARNGNIEGVVSFLKMRTFAKGRGPSSANMFEQGGGGEGPKTFANFDNIWIILENLSCDISKTSLRKNFINLKLLTSFSMRHVGLTEQLFSLYKMELNIFFYLPNFIPHV